MINCLYKNKRICSFDLKNQYGHYIFERVKNIREAGEDHLLKCEECGRPVILKAGDKKIPHFAHLKSGNCNYGNYSKETEEHLKGKLILYHYFREKYPSASVMVDYRLSNGRRANILVIFENGEKLAVEYQRKDIKIRDWNIRHRSYQKLGINDIWILSTKQYKPHMAIKKDKFVFFKDLLIDESLYSTAVFLNTDNKLFTMIRKMEYKNEDDITINQKYFWQDYKLDDIDILPDGTIRSNFHQKYQLEKKYFLEQIEKSEKQKALKRIEMNKALRNSIRNYQKGLTKKKKNIKGISNKNIHKNYISNIRKSIEQLESEAEQSQKENPAGPWMDSENNRWGFCRECGIFTKDWVTFDGTKNTCICRDCQKNKR